MIAALRKLSNLDSSLILVGFEDLAENFPDLVKTSRHIPLPRKHWSRWNRIERILRVLAALRVISVVTYQATERRLVRRRGLLPLGLFQGGWCQDEKLVDPNIRKDLFENMDRDAARTRVGIAFSQPSTNKNSVFFIHIRRGDYLSWPTPEHPAVLPDNWYRDAIREIQKSNPGAHFLILSDDQGYSADFAAQLEKAISVNASPVETLAYMSVCTGGILSASTFSWWGAWLANQVSPGPFIAPLQWITWREGRWDDSHSLEDSSFLTWMPVDNLPKRG